MGIVGIERKIEEKRKETDKNISEVLQSKNTEICVTMVVVFL